jgi:hypothetical protein
VVLCKYTYFVGISDNIIGKFLYRVIVGLWLLISELSHLSVDGMTYNGLFFTFSFKSFLTLNKVVFFFTVVFISQ